MIDLFLAAGDAIPQEVVQDMISEEGIRVSWTIFAMIVTGIAYIVRSELQGRTNSKNITALWEKVNKLMERK